MLATKCRLLLDPAMLMKIKILPNVDCRVIVQLESTNHSRILWTEPRLRPTVANAFREEHSELALLRDSTYPRWASSNSNSLLLTFTNTPIERFNFLLLLHQVGSCLNKQLISISIKNRFRNILPNVRESDENFVAPEKLLMSSKKEESSLWEMYLSISDFKNNGTNFLFLSELEMNWPSNSSLKMKKRAIVLNLLLAPEDPMVKPTEHEIVRRLKPKPGEMSRCFPPNHKLTPWSTGGTTKNWHLNPRVQRTDRLWWSACNPCLQQTAWACKIWKKSWLNQNATQLRLSIFAKLFCSLEDWFKKNKKKCPRVVSSNASECTTLRDEMCVLGEKRNQCASWPESCNYMDSMCDCTLWQQIKNLCAKVCMRKMWCALGVMSTKKSSMVLWGFRTLDSLKHCLNK